MSKYAMEKLKKDLDKVVEELAEKGVSDPRCLEMVKTALSAKSKILTIEAMERVAEEGYSRGYDRRANGQFADGEYRDNMGRNYRDNVDYRDNMPEYRDGDGNYRDSSFMQKMLSRADPHEREFLQKLMRRM